MFIVYRNGEKEHLLNLDQVSTIKPSIDSSFGETSYNVEAHLTDGGVIILANSKAKDIALRHIANIADAIAESKNIYVIGTNPRTDTPPSRFFAIDE